MKKEYEKLIDKMMKKKNKLSGREFLKLIFLSGWDTGIRQLKKEEIKFLKELKKEEIKFLKELSEMRVIRNDSSLKKIEQRIKKLEDKTEP